MKALVVVDVQRDFCEGGRLPVQGGRDLAKRIAEFIGKHHSSYTYVVATKDAHIRIANNQDNSGHFGNPPDYVNTWPEHCVGAGQNFQHPLNYTFFHETFKKGRGVPAYSGFEGVGNLSRLTLDEYLRGQGCTEIDVCGIALDYCVRATVESAVALDYKVNLLTNLCVPVDIARKGTVELYLESIGANLD